LLPQMLIKLFLRRSPQVAGMADPRLSTPVTVPVVVNVELSFIPRTIH
jgi:hypothetical protein